MVVGYDWGARQRGPVRRDGRRRISERRVGIPRDDVCGVNGPALQGMARWAVPTAAEFFNHRKGRVPMKTNKLHFPHPHRGAGAVRLCVGGGFRNHSRTRGRTAAATGTDGGT